MKEETEELLSATKLAALIGATPTKVKKAIAELGIEPSAVKCNCNYYKVSDAEKIKGAMK